MSADSVDVGAMVRCARHCAVHAVGCGARACGILCSLYASL